MKRLMIAIAVMAVSPALFASELEKIKAGAELGTISAEALRQIEVAAIPAPAQANAEKEGQAGKDNITAGYLEMEIGTMEKLYMGYLVLEARSVYESGDENADLLLRLRGNSFIAKGILMTRLEKKFPFQTVCRVYLKTLPGQSPSSAVFLRSRTFFSENAAKEYQKSLATDGTAKVYFTVRYNYREISESPFEIHSIEMPGIADKMASGSANKYIGGFAGEGSYDSGGYDSGFGGTQAGLLLPEDVIWGGAPSGSVISSRKLSGVRQVNERK